MSDLIVIPSARLVAPELQADFGAIPPALIPLDGRTAVQYILDAAPRSSHAIVAGHEGLALLEDAARRMPGVTVADVGPTASLGETVLGALDGTTMPGRLVVNFADTLVPGLPAGGDAIAVREQADAYRFTAFRRASGGGIGEILEKGRDKGGATLPVFVGAFAFAAPDLLLDALDAAVADGPAGVDPLYVAVAAYVGQRGPEALHEVGVWHDLGHVDTYYRTRQRLFIDRRAFNSVEVDARSGVIRKRSTNAAKLRREVAWYRGLPPATAVLAPRVLEDGGTDDEAYVDLEFYGYPPLADAYLFGAWDVGAWDLALGAVQDAAERLHGQRLLLPEAQRTAALRAMYVDKTAERLAAVLDDRTFAPLRGEEILISGRSALGLDGAVAALPALAERLGLCAPRPLGIVHGDLCLSNVLYDRRNGIVRLVDPRGSFGHLTLHGDPLYDHAKLAHSIHGDYDHLLRGRFTLELDAGGAWLDVQLSSLQRDVKALHRRRARARHGERLALVDLIEALLFLTMVPLHRDRPRSQLAFLVRGLGLLSELAAGERPATAALELAA